MKAHVRKLVLLLFLVIPPLAQSQNEWTLRPWVQVIGGINGEQLGTNVTKAIPRPNLPYKATISKLGSLGFYSIQTQTDTLPKKVFIGENAITADLNNDGYTDVVFSKSFSGYDTVFAYWGNAAGIDTLNPLIIPNENRSDRLAVGCIADINNDGKLDLILTANGFGLNKGKLYFYFGPNISSTPNATLTGDSAFVGLGLRCTVGDLNSDGLNDLIVRGEENWQNVPDSTRHDYVNIYWGTGVNQLNLNLGMKLISQQTYSGLAVFDVNGDGRADLLWTNHDSLTWINVHYGRSNFQAIPDKRLKPPSFASFTFDIVNAGDMNGDGYNDVAVGAGGFQNVFHYVLIYAGGPSMDEKFDAAVGTDNASFFGQSIAPIGDIDGDGVSDLLVGAPHYGRFGLNEEKGYWGIFLGDRHIATAVEMSKTLPPNVFRLEQNYPNPFNPATLIRYELTSQAYVKIKVFNVLGEEVAQLVDRLQQPGSYVAEFNASKFPAGVYLYQMHAAKSPSEVWVESRRMVLLK